MRIEHVPQTLGDIAPIFFAAVEICPKGDNGAFARIMRSMIDIHQQVLSHVKEHSAQGSASGAVLNEGISGVVAHCVAREFAREGGEIGATEALKTLINGRLDFLTEAVDRELQTHQETTSESGSWPDFDDGADADDLILFIKTHVMECGYELDRWMQNMRFAESTRKSLVAKLVEYSINLARSAAYRWGKRTALSDRQKAFLAALAPALRIVREEMMRVTEKALATAGHRSSDGMRFRALFDTLEAMDMGYADHPEHDMGWLKETLAGYIDTVVGSVMPDCGAVGSRVSALLRAVFVRQMETVAIRSWKTRSEEMIARIEVMTDAEYERWEREEGGKPMSIDDVLTDLSEGVKTLSLDGTIEHIDMDEVLQAARKKMAMLWGLSDAYCKLRFDDEKQ